MCVKSKLTILFDTPFWIGVCERITDDQLEVAKIVFGSEPKDFEIYGFVLQNWWKLKYSPPVHIVNTIERRMNPKRVQRQINEQLSQKSIGTKAQQALKLQHEEGKIERRQKSKQKKELEAQRKFELKQEKKKQKHKGR